VSTAPGTLSAVSIGWIWIMREPPFLSLRKRYAGARVPMTAVLPPSSTSVPLVADVR